MHDAMLHPEGVIGLHHCFGDVPVSCHRHQLGPPASAGTTGVACNRPIGSPAYIRGELPVLLRGVKLCQQGLLLPGYRHQKISLSPARHYGDLISCGSLLLWITTVIGAGQYDTMHARVQMELMLIPMIPRRS